MRIIDFNQYKIDESEIVKRILAGEKELFEILLRRNNQKLYRVVRSYIKDDVEIEDIMQNTHLKAFEKLYQFKHNSLYSTWLIRIGINETLSRLKEKGRLQHVNHQDIILESNTILEMPDSNQLNPEKEMIRQEAKKLLEATIDALDPKYRIVYMLREIEGMSIKEISISLDLSESNIKVRLHRAKNMLKEKLFEVTHDNEIFEFGFSRCDRITDEVMEMIL